MIGEEAKIAREYLTGLTTIELGERYGMGRDTIARVLRAQGVTMRALEGLGVRCRRLA